MTLGIGWSRVGGWALHEKGETPAAFLADRTFTVSTDDDRERPDARPLAGIAAVGLERSVGRLA